MKQLVLIGLMVTAVFATAAVAVAQYAVPVVTVSVTDTPKKGGTKKKPVIGSTTIKFDVSPESNSTLAGVDYGISPNFKISGAGFKPCTAQTINAKGESACGQAPIVGTGAATALLGPDEAPIQFTVNVYAAGANGLALALRQTDGSMLVAFAARLSDNRLAFSIPTNVQQPATGPYSHVTSLTADLGPASVVKTTTKKVKVKGKKKKKTVKVKKEFSLVSRVGCAGGKDNFDVKLSLADNPDPPSVNPITGTTSVACRK